MKVIISQRVVFQASQPAYEVRVPDIDVLQYLELPLDDFYRYFGRKEDVANDLLLVAGSIYLVDQIVPRSHFENRWTRELEVELPVADPELWATNVELLNTTCSFLTGDVWSFNFTEQRRSVFGRQYRNLRRKRLGRVDAVSLFSGGLDSFIGTTNWLATNGGRLALVGHYDLGSSAKSVQARMAQQLGVAYPNRLSLIQARAGGAIKRQDGSSIYSQVSDSPKETSFRSRSMIFLALGLYAASRLSAAEPIPLLIPENGFIALNPPLTQSRLGGCSTRTAHPLFLRYFSDLVTRLGIPNPILNPLGGCTKGEAIQQSANFSLVKDLASQTVSCAHPTRRETWVRRSANNCGYCIPCILRRAAMHRVGLDDGQDFGIDVCAGELELDEDKASDLRAVLNWLNDVRTGAFNPSFEAETLALPDAARDDAKHVLESGATEILQFFKDKAQLDILDWADLAE